jgi:Mesyanzhinovviridae DNA polymerase
MSSDWQAPSELPDLRRVDIIALDLETKDGGLYAKHGSAWPWGEGYICGVSVAYHADGAIRSHYFPIQHPDGQNFAREQVARWLKDHAAVVSFVTKSGLYDWGWAWADLGIEMPPPARLDEIDALATMVDENRRQYSLDALCAWRGFPGKDEALLHEGCAALGFPARSRKTFKPQSVLWQLPAHFVGPYAETDAVRTLQLFQSLNPILDRENTRQAYRLEIDLLPMVHAMRKRGIRVDIAAAEQARDLILAKRDAVLAELSEKLGTPVGMDEINGRKWLVTTFDRLGVKYERTEKGNPSFKGGKKGWMRQSSHWLPTLIAAAHQLHQYGDNFLQTQILEHIKNGRVYGEIHPHRSDAGGARSFRFSYSHPPLQQMPKHDEVLAPLVRRVFLPEQGETWAELDFSQQEFRLLVHFAVRHHLSGATAARDQYINDPSTDIHAYTSELTKGELPRQDSKTFNYANIYGAGDEELARQLNKPVAEAKRLRALYNTNMPFVPQLVEQCKRAAQHDGVFKLFNGARRHFNLWAPGGKLQKGAGPCEHDEAMRRAHDPGHSWYGQKLWRAETYKAPNVLIQSAAAIQTKLWMRACFREGVIPLLQMHDCLDLSVTSPKTAEMVAHLGEEAIKLEVPMKVDVHFGRNWGDAKHTWDELHTATGSPVELVVELPDNRERTQRESPKFRNDFDEAPNLAAHEAPSTNDNLPWEGDVVLTALNEIAEAPIADATTDADPLPQSPPPQAPQSPPPPGGNGRGDGFDTFTSGVDHGGNGARPSSGSKTAAERDTYAKDHAGEPFIDVFLRDQGYRLADIFDYTLADGTLLYKQNRYELRPGIKPTEKRKSKRFLVHRIIGGSDVFGAGARRVIYNWPAIMRAGPGNYVFAPEGENKAKALIDKGLLATTVLAHDWARECVAALIGQHLIILADHDKQGDRLAKDAHKKLALVVASIRVVTTAHLWKHLPTGARDIAPGDDVKDWIALGGDPVKLLDICREIPAEGVIAAEPYQFQTEADIAPWQWLYGRHLLRGEVVGTVATGGTGKSTTSIVEALAMASGRALLGEEVPAPQRVVLINLEDTRNTMDKRIAAVMRQYGLTPADIGNRLIVIAKGEIKIKVARQLRSGDVERNELMIKALTRLMTEHCADVLSIDSLVRTHRVNENDNSAMQEVVECFEDVAVEARCAVHLWHHTRKLGGERATVEAARGASAFVDACRSARVFETMSAKEHEQLVEIAPDMLPPGHYFRSFNGKRSFAPPADQSSWFKLTSVELSNGDNVGVVTAWTYPASQEDISPEVAERIIKEIGEGTTDGQRFTNHKQAATARQAWPLVQKHCPDKTREQCCRIVTGWIKKGLLYEDTYDDPVYRRQRRGLFARRPSTEEKEG